MFCIRIRFLWLQPKIWIRSDFRIHPFSLYPPNRNLNNFYSSGKFIIKKIVDWKEQYLRMMAKEANWNKNLLITVNKCSFVIFYTFLLFFNTFLNFRFGSVFRIPVLFQKTIEYGTLNVQEAEPHVTNGQGKKMLPTFFINTGRRKLLPTKKKAKPSLPKLRKSFPCWRLNIKNFPHSQHYYVRTDAKSGQRWNPDPVILSDPDPEFWSIIMDPDPVLCYQFRRKKNHWKF